MLQIWMEMMTGTGQGGAERDLLRLAQRTSALQQCKKRIARYARPVTGVQSSVMKLLSVSCLAMHASALGFICLHHAAAGRLIMQAGT